MKSIFLLPLSLMLLITTAFAAQEKGQQPEPVAHGEMKVFTPDKMEWQDAKALPPGAKMALLEGDLKTGLYTFQLKFPAGYKIPPHWHTNMEHVTVLSGEFKLGAGENFDDSKLQDLGAGSFAYMPGRMVHFGKAGAETVVQVHGMAPWDINYINKTDDPRSKL